MAMSPYLAALLVAITPTSFPHTAVAGKAWQVTLRASAPPTVVSGSLRARAVGAHGVYRARLVFPRAGAWTVSALLRGRTTKLGTVAVDVPRDPLLVNPFAIAVDSSGALLVAQLDKGPLVRIVGGRAQKVADVRAVQIDPAGYTAGFDGVVRDPGGKAVSPPLDADAVAADAAGNLYVSLYAGEVRKVGGGTIAGGFAHPHALVYAAGALYVADTENRRIRRVDLTTGRVTTFG